MNLLKSFDKILVLAPHTDDGELGCGATISMLCQLGKDVTYVAFSTIEESVPKEFPRDILKKEVRKATKVLGIKEENLIVLNYAVRKLNFYRQDILEDLIKIRNRGNYDLVLIPSPNDIHQDHSTVSQKAIRTFKHTTLFGYELTWNNLTFHTQCFVSFGEEHVKRKVEAVKKYVSQSFRHYFDEDFIRSLAKMRGIQIGKEFAEVFEVIRLVI